MTKEEVAQMIAYCDVQGNSYYNQTIVVIPHQFAYLCALQSIGLISLNMIDSSKELIEYVKCAHNSTAKQLAHNIIRGHLRSISSDIEDGIAIFISKALPQGYKLYLDPTIHIDKKGNRPDLLVVDSHDNVAALIEIKANMGWCRDARLIIDKIVENDNKFRSTKNLKCEFSTQDEVEVSYEEGVKLFLLSLTDLNCPASKHDLNKQYASKNKISYYNLFTGWYDSLQVKDAAVFISDLVASLPKMKEDRE